MEAKSAAPTRPGIAPWQGIIQPCMAQAAIPEPHRQGGLSNRQLFLPVLEEGCLRSDASMFGSLVRALFLVCPSHLCCVQAEREEGVGEKEKEREGGEG